MADDYQLDIFPGDFGLPSLDRECLIVLAYCGMSGLNVTLHERTDLYFAKVPALRCTSGAFYGADQIINFLEKKFKKLPENKFDVWSFKALVEAKLDPCFQYLFWYDNDNYNEFLRGWYAQRLPFPTNFFVPSSLRKGAVMKLEKNFSPKILESESKTKMIENAVMADARYCLNLFNDRLEKSGSYFFGDTPNSFDAVLFAYLALLLKVPVKKETIKNHIRISKSLERFVDMFQIQHLSKFNSSRFSSSQSKNSSEESQTSSIKWSDVIFSGAIATILMVFYAFSSGIVSTQIEYEDEFVEESEENHE